MQNPLISIIVPIYNVEPYLQRCLDSIINQTYSNLEIILIDDGSSDKCPQICDEYSAQDKRISVIHKAHGGPSDARNKGLDICQGDYISFIDSDDWIDPSYVRTLLIAIEKTKSDISIVNFTKTHSNCTFVLKNSDEKYDILSPAQAIKKLWDRDVDTIFVTAWGKLFKRELYNSLRFPKGKIFEDEYTSYKVLYKSNQITFIDIPLYIYFQRKDSIMGSAKRSSIRALRAQVEKYLFFRRKKEVGILNTFIRQLWWDVIFAYSQIKLNIPISDYKTGKEKELLCIYKHIMSDCSNISASTAEKFFYKFFRSFPQIYVLYQKFSPIRIRSK